MGFYANQVFPRVMNVLMDTKQTRRLRERVCAPLHGEVVEVGFGTGHNLPFMPPAVTRLFAVDPMVKGRDLASSRVDAASCDVQFVGLDGERLPLEDDSVDDALSTWTLCSIPDPVAAVAEIARVLRPGGTFHFVEHGLAPDDGVRRWQHRCNGLQNRVACGCNIDRDIPALITQAGMVVEDLDRFYVKGHPKPLGWTFQGRAVPA